MKAILIKTSFLTRVIVSDDATKEEILERGRHRLKKDIAAKHDTSIEGVGEDTESPYDAALDAPVIYPFAQHFKIIKD